MAEIRHQVTDSPTVWSRLYSVYRVYEALQLCHSAAPPWSNDIVADVGISEFCIETMLTDHLLRAFHSEIRWCRVPFL